MGAIEIDPPEDLYQEVKAEECVGEGGHQFERTGERYQGGDFEVQCARCYIMGWEKPDEGDPPREAKTILPGEATDTGPRAQMRRCPESLRHLYEGETDTDYLWPNPPRGELPW